MTPRNCVVTVSPLDRNNQSDYRLMNNLSHDDNWSMFLIDAECEELTLQYICIVTFAPDNTVQFRLFCKHANWWSKLFRTFEWVPFVDIHWYVRPNVPISRYQWALYTPEKQCHRIHDAFIHRLNKLKQLQEYPGYNTPQT